MRLIILSTLIIVFATIVNAMENEEVREQDDLKVKKKIVAHIKQLLIIADDEIDISKTDTLLTSLPNRYKYYRATRKNRFDYNIICSYISADDELFSSCEENDFSRFLKQQKFLEKNFTASQLVSLFDLLQFKQLDLTIVNPPEHTNDKVKDLLWLLDFDKNKDKWPEMKKTADGIEVTFWAISVSSDIYQKSTVKISKDYKVTHNIEAIKQ